MRAGEERRSRIRARRMHWWVCAIEKVSGRPCLQGPHDSEAEASQFGFEKVKDGDFTVEPFPTVNKMAARDMYKNKMLEQTGQLAGVFKRARYRVA